MSTSTPRRLQEITYYDSAQKYLRSLPLEHFMEATTQATQRKITLESLDLVHARRPEVQVFNELLVQYPLKGKRIGKIVPDNMVVYWHTPIQADGSYDVPLQPVGPFWVLEYVSKSNKRKDYEQSFDKYEQQLKVPYYLVFYPDTQDLTLYHHNGQKYLSIPPNDQGRHPLPELEMEVGLLDSWVRFWFRGELLPLPGDLQQEVDDLRRRMAAETRRADAAVQQTGRERHRADQEKQRADQEKQRADQEKQRADAAVHQAEQERQARLALEQELAKFRAQGDR